MICYCKHNCSCGGDMYSYVPFYKDILNKFKPKKVLEWGPGINTLMALDYDCEVWSFEHDKKYMPDFDNERHYPILVDLNSDKYIEIPDIDFDLYFVDGRRRSECIESVYNSCSEDFVCCIHDAQRFRYQESINLFKNIKFYGDGFCVASKE